MNSEAGNFLPPPSTISFSEGRSIIVSSCHTVHLLSLSEREGEGFFFEQACFLPHSDSALSHRRAAIMVRGGTTYFSVKTFIRLVAARPQDRVPGPMPRRTCPTELSHLMIVRLSLVIFTSCFCAAAIIVICSLKLQKNDMDVNHPDMSETCAHSFFLSQRRGRKTTDDL